MKTCTACNNTFSLSSFFKHGYKADGSIRYYTKCKDCIRDKHNERNRQWKLNNPDKCKEISKKYWQTVKSDPEKLQKIYKSRNESPSSKFRVYNPETAKARKVRYKEELHDEYIKKLLTHKSYGLISAKDIPDSLIKLKRQQLILTRKLRNHE